MSMSLLSIGAIVRAHGVRGLVRVRPFDGRSQTFASVKRLFVGGEPRDVEQAVRERGEWLLKLRGVDDRDGAEALRGREVAIPREQLPAPADDELYVADLVGCALVGLDGAALGTVRQVVSTGAQELLVLDRVGGGEAMVPFVEPIVVDVDLAARRIVCDPPEGLLDLDRPGAPPRSDEVEGE